MPGNRFPNPSLPDAEAEGHHARSEENVRGRFDQLVQPFRRDTRERTALAIFGDEIPVESDDVRLARRELEQPFRFPPMTIGIGCCTGFGREGWLRTW